MFYIKKPIIVQAEQVLLKGKKFVNYFDFEYQVFNSLGETFILINTLEGVMRCSDKDYLISGVDNEIYPCKESIFEKSYDKVN